MKPGVLFGESIRTEKVKRRHYSDGGANLRERGFLFPIIVVIVGLVLLVKLFQLQIINGAQFQTLSDSNRIRTQIIHAPRGVIFDRHGQSLVLNTPGFIKVTKKGEGDTHTEQITREEALKLLSERDQNIEIATAREYPYKDILAHALGYIGQISKEELESSEYSDYLGTDWVGKAGIERQYEHILKGIDGKQLVEVDALGRKVRPLGTTDPVPGEDITLTIDLKLQKAVYEATKDVKRGAVIVSTPTGEILAMVSRPSYDPNLFTLDKNYPVATDSAYKTREEILTDNTGQPVLDRAISGIYPPGSTFKLVTAAAGLENKIIDKNYKVKDTGIIKIGEFSYANWFYTNNGRTEPGELDVIRGLARSNDIFFYRLGEKVGVDKLSQTAEKYGMGKRLGIDLTGESAGLVPNEEWKKEEIGESWYLGDTFHYGIGQGFLLTTPLQVNAFTQVVANGGSLYKPHLLKSQKPEVKAQNLLTEENQNLIRQGMVDSCEKGGVAWPLFEFKVQNSKLKVDGKNILDVKTGSNSASLKDHRHVTIACKTGTSQHGSEKTLPHAWITLFAPAYNPEIVVTVLNEESGEGSNEAAPIAKKILEAYFTK